MSINPRDLDVTAAAYEEAAKKLREAAEILRGGPAASISRIPASNNGTGPVAPGSTRLQQLQAWLARHGPATRKEIKDNSGIPASTVSVLLLRKNFDKDEEGRWKVKEAE